MHYLFLDSYQLQNPFEHLAYLGRDVDLNNSLDEKRRTLFDLFYAAMESERFRDYSPTSHVELHEYLVKCLELIHRLAELYEKGEVKLIWTDGKEH